MAVKRAMIAAVVGQFGHPRGTAGKVDGWVMAHRSSKPPTQQVVVSLLDVRPTGPVLAAWSETGDLSRGPCEFRLISARPVD
jgi:hypothetical protein